MEKGCSDSPRLINQTGSPDETLVTSSDLKPNGTIVGHHASSSFPCPGQSSPDMELDFILCSLITDFYQLIANVGFWPLIAIPMQMAHPVNAILFPDASHNTRRHGLDPDPSAKGGRGFGTEQTFIQKKFVLMPGTFPLSRFS